MELLTELATNKEEALLTACSNGKDLDKVIELISKLQANINCQDSQSRTPLHLSVWYGNTDITQVLLQNGAAVDIRDCNQRTPLHLAARYGRLWDIRLLAGAYAEIEVCDRWGKRPGESFDHRLSKLSRERTTQLLNGLYGPEVKLQPRASDAALSKKHLGKELNNESKEAFEELENEVLVIQSSFRCYQARCKAIARWMTKLNLEKFAKDEFCGNAPVSGKVDGTVIQVPKSAPLSVKGIVKHDTCRDPSGNEFTVYFVLVTCPEALPVSDWIVYRRYANFFDLSNDLGNAGAFVPDVPKKRFLNKLDPKFVNNRRRDLEAWMVELENINFDRGNKFGVGVQVIPHYRTFLTKNANVPPGELVKTHKEGDAPVSTVRTTKEANEELAVCRTLQYAHARITCKQLGQGMEFLTQLLSKLKKGMAQAAEMQKALDELMKSSEGLEAGKKEKAAQSLKDFVDACHTIKEKLLDPSFSFKAMEPQDDPQCHSSFVLDLDCNIMEGEVNAALEMGAQAQALLDDLIRDQNQIQKKRTQAMEALKDLCQKTKELKLVAEKENLKDAMEPVAIAIYDATEALEELLCQLKDAKTVKEIEIILDEGNKALEDATSKINSCIADANTARYKEAIELWEMQYKAIAEDSMNEGLTRVFSPSDEENAQDFKERLIEVDRLVESMHKLDDAEQPKSGRVGSIQTIYDDMGKAMPALEEAYSNRLIEKERDTEDRALLSRTIGTVEQSLEVAKAQSEEDDISRETYSSLWEMFEEAEGSIAHVKDLIASTKSTFPERKKAVLEADENVKSVLSMVEKVQDLVKQENDKKEAVKQNQRSILEKSNLALSDLKKRMNATELVGQVRVDVAISEASEASQKAETALQNDDLEAISELVAEALEKVNEAKSVFDLEVEHQQEIERAMAMVQEELEQCKRGVSVLQQQKTILQGQEPPALTAAIADLEDELSNTEAWLKDDNNKSSMTAEVSEQRVALLKEKLSAAQQELDSASSAFQLYLESKDAIQRRCNCQVQRLEHCKKIATAYVPSPEDLAWHTLNKAQAISEVLKSEFTTPLSCTPEKDLAQKMKQMATLDAEVDEAEQEVLKSSKRILLLNSERDGVKRENQTFERFWVLADAVDADIVDLASVQLQECESFSEKHAPCLKKCEDDLKQLAEAGVEAKVSIENEKRQMEELDAWMKSLHVEDCFSSLEQVLSGSPLPQELSDRLEASRNQTEMAWELAKASTERGSSEYRKALEAMASEVEGLCNVVAEAVVHQKEEAQQREKLGNTLKELENTLMEEKESADANLGNDQETNSAPAAKALEFWKAWDIANSTLENIKEDMEQPLNVLENKVLQASQMVSAAADLLEEAVLENAMHKVNWKNKLNDSLVKTENDLLTLENQANIMGISFSGTPKATHAVFNEFTGKFNATEEKLQDALNMLQAGDKELKETEAAVLDTEKATAEVSLLFSEAAEAYEKEQLHRQKLGNEMKEMQQKLAELESAAALVAGPELDAEVDGAQSYSDVSSAVNTAGEAFSLAEKSANSAPVDEFEKAVSAAHEALSDAETKLELAQSHKAAVEKATQKTEMLAELHQKYNQLTKNFQDAPQFIRDKVSSSVDACTTSFLDAQATAESTSTDVDQLRNSVNHSLEIIQNTSKELETARLEYITAEIEEVSDCTDHLMDSKVPACFGPDQIPSELVDKVQQIRTTVATLKDRSKAEAIRNLKKVEDDVLQLDLLLNEAESLFTVKSKEHEDRENQRKFQMNRLHLLSQRLSQTKHRSKDIKDRSISSKNETSIAEAESLLASLNKIFQSPPSSNHDEQASEAQMVTDLDNKIQELENQVASQLHLQGLIRTHVYDAKTFVLLESDPLPSGSLCPALDSGEFCNSPTWEESPSLEVAFLPQEELSFNRGAPEQETIQSHSQSGLKSPEEYQKPKSSRSLLIFILVAVLLASSAAAFTSYNKLQMQQTNEVDLALTPPTPPKEEGKVKRVVQKIKRMHKVLGIGHLVKKISARQSGKEDVQAGDSPLP